MTNTTLKSKIIIRNDSHLDWEEKNPILLKGEFGYANTSGVLKIGDGVLDWKTLPKFNAANAACYDHAPTQNDADLMNDGYIWVDMTTSPPGIYVLVYEEEVGRSWQKLITEQNIGTANIMKLADFATQPGAGKATGFVDKALTANKLSSGRRITLTGGVTGNQIFDGASDITIATTLPASGVTAGSYIKVTVNDKGIITGTPELVEGDVPRLPMDKIMGLGTAAAKNIGLESGQVPVLGVDGKLDTKILPQLAIVDVVEASSQAEMLAKNVQQGDVCLRSDAPAGMYILAGTNPAILSNWKRVPTPGDAVLSVNGKIGVVTLSSDNVQEGGRNLYHTQARFDAAFTAKSTSNLKEGENLYFTESRAYSVFLGIVTDPDNIFILDGGNA